MAHLSRARKAKTDGPYKFWDAANSEGSESAAGSRAMASMMPVRVWLHRFGVEVEELHSSDQ